MFLCKRNNREFKAYSFEEIGKNKKLIAPARVNWAGAAMHITQMDGFTVRLMPGEYLTVWEDGGLIPAPFSHIEKMIITN